MSKPHTVGTNLDKLVFPNRDVGRVLRSTCRDLYEVVRVLDGNRQSDMAGCLHALVVEIRQLAAIAESRPDEMPLMADECASIAIAH